MSGVRFALIAAVSAVALGLTASAGAASASTSSGTVTSGSAGADSAAGCLAHVVGGQGEDWYDVYTPGCTGHDEPELDPVSSAPGSAQNITWRAVLPADGTSAVSSVGPTFWFGGTVKDSNPIKIGGEGVPGVAVLPGLDHHAVHTGRGLPAPARARHLHGVLARLDDSAAGERHHRAGRVQWHAHERCRNGSVRHARPRHRRRPHLGAVAGRGLPGAGYGRDQWGYVERARARQSGRRPADARV
jgi:hypothetical protein